jgi:flagellar biosynthesis component FlhA
MINLEKKDLEAVLITISTFSDKGVLTSGLLSESLTFGTKRKLQKIHKEVYKIYKEFIEDKTKLVEEFKDDKEKLESEYQELLKEKVVINAEPILFSMLENVSTEKNYDFDIIEKIAV